MFADDELSPSHKAVGQVIEWLVWAAIVGRSERITHVFLPLDDRGVDGIVRRVDDEAMCAVQIKGSSSRSDGGIRIVVRRAALDDPNVIFVVALLDPTTITLGDTVYVVDAETVLRLGSPSHGPNGAVVELHLPYPPRRLSTWSPYACALTDLPAHLFPSVPDIRLPRPDAAALRSAPVTPLMPGPPARRQLLGHLAELELLRLLGEAPSLNTFKSFPTSRKPSTWCATARLETFAAFR